MSMTEVEDQLDVEIVFNKDPEGVDLDQLARDTESTEDGLEVTGDSLEESGTEVISLMTGGNVMTTADDLIEEISKAVKFINMVSERVEDVEYLHYMQPPGANHGQVLIPRWGPEWSTISTIRKNLREAGKHLMRSNAFQASNRALERIGKLVRWETAALACTGTPQPDACEMIAGFYNAVNVTFDLGESLGQNSLGEYERDSHAMIQEEFGDDL